MKDQVRILVSVDESVDAELVHTMLAIEPEVQIVGLCEGLGDRWDSLAEEAGELLVVACDGYSDNVLRYIGAVTKRKPDRPVIVLSSGPANGFVRRVFQAGADDMITLPEAGAQNANGALAEEIVFTLQKAVARKRSSVTEAAITRGAMICVLGPKGGIGKTLTSTNLAVALAQDGHTTAIVDLDLQFGDVALALGITPGKTAYDLAVSSGTLDAEKLDAYLAWHDSGVRVLVAPTRPDQAAAVTVDFLRDVYGVLRSAFDFVVVDTPPGFTPEVIASIDSSSSVCMVGMLDSLSLKNTKLGLETLALMGYGDERVKLVLNRADSRVGITHDDVVQIVGRKPDVLVPSHRDIARFVNEGRPIVVAGKRSEAARSFAALAGLYSAADNGSQRANGRGFLRKRG